MIETGAVLLDAVDGVDVCLSEYLVSVFVVCVELDVNDLFGRVEGSSVGELLRNSILS